VIQTVRVKSCAEDGTAQVVHIRQSACSGDCHKCAGCGAVQEAVVLTARNPVGAAPGDLVVVESATKAVLSAAAVLYLMPLALFFLGYWLGQTLWLRGGALGCAAFALGIAGCILYDRRMAGKKTVEYTITGFAPE